MAEVVPKTNCHLFLKGKYNFQRSRCSFSQTHDLFFSFVSCIPFDRVIFYLIARRLYQRRNHVRHRLVGPSAALLVRERAGRLSHDVLHDLSKAESWYVFCVSR